MEKERRLWGSLSASMIASGGLAARMVNSYAFGLCIRAPNAVERMSYQWISPRRASLGCLRSEQEPVAGGPD